MEASQLDSEPAMLTPRSYQLEMLEESMSGNTIVAVLEDSSPSFLCMLTSGKDGHR